MDSLLDEANNWFSRNKEKIENKTRIDDIAYQSFLSTKFIPKNVLEIGCSNGYRLDWFSKDFECDCYGIDLSSEAISDGQKKFPLLDLQHGNYDILDTYNKKFDLIILGFFDYYLPRDDIFKLIYLVNSKLKNGGLVLDYGFYSKIPYVNDFLHDNKLKSHKLDVPSGFLWNPQYIEIFRRLTNHDGKLFAQDQNDSVIVSIIMKINSENAYVKGQLTDNQINK
jgi:hypothetical protein